MCVVLICPPKVRPPLSVLQACHEANPHGAGVAWREKRRIHWRKNLSALGVHRLIGEVPGEVIIHFRWASIGGVDPLLCHPFPVSADALPELSGTAKAVLFHNGTWSAYADALPIVGDLDGPVSDSRMAAALAFHRGANVLRQLSGRWAVMMRRETELFGDWQPWRGLLVSNTYFVSHLREPKKLCGRTPHSADDRRRPNSPGSGQLPLLFGKPTR
jgi:hypothetical protein